MGSEADDFGRFDHILGSVRHGAERLAIGRFDAGPPREVAREMEVKLPDRSPKPYSLEQRGQRLDNRVSTVRPISPVGATSRLAPG